MAHFRFRRSFGNVGTRRFRGARPDATLVNLQLFATRRAISIPQTRRHIIIQTTLRILTPQYHGRLYSITRHRHSTAECLYRRQLRDNLLDTRFSNHLQRWRQHPRQV